MLIVKMMVNHDDHDQDQKRDGRLQGQPEWPWSRRWSQVHNQADHDAFDNHADDQDNDADHDAFDHQADQDNHDDQHNDAFDTDSDVVDHNDDNETYETKLLIRILIMRILVLVV